MHGINPADTAWMLVATALVLLMTPALGFFYGGLVRAKNALNTMMMSFASLGFVGLAWALAGYTLAFGTGSRWIGGLRPSLPRGRRPRGAGARSRTSSSWRTRGRSRSSRRR